MILGKALYDVTKPETLPLLPEGVLRQCIASDDGVHCASWDAVQLQDGTVLFSLCSELTTGCYAALALFDPKTMEVTLLKELTELTFHSDRTIRPSKVHTAMSLLPDGRVIMITHTTDKAPQHPAWMPEAYYAHPFEGFRGSTMLRYDPKTRTFENLGIPVPYETLYGGIYDPVGKIYYAIGFLKGELYGIDPESHAVRNYGQVVERASYRLVNGPDENIYFTTRNGALRRINVFTKEVEAVPVQLPKAPGKGKLPPYFSFAVSGPDGRLYMAGMHDRHLTAYDPASGKFAIVGEYLQEEKLDAFEDPHFYLGAMGFDKEGMLYYAVCGVRRNVGEDWKEPAYLFAWDVLHGGDPVPLGLIGTPERVVTTTPILLMDHARDEMLIIGTNHGSDSPDLNVIDLAALRESMPALRRTSHKVQKQAEDKPSEASQMAQKQTESDSGKTDAAKETSEEGEQPVILAESTSGHFRGMTFTKLRDPLIMPGNTNYLAHEETLRHGREVLAVNSPQCKTWPVRVLKKKFFIRTMEESDCEAASGQEPKVIHPWLSGVKTGENHSRSEQRFLSRLGELPIELAESGKLSEAELEMLTFALITGEKPRAGISREMLLKETEAANQKGIDCLPRYPGRTYLACPTMAVHIADGRVLVATKDGMLAVVSNLCFEDAVHPDVDQSKEARGKETAPEPEKKTQVSAFSIGAPSPYGAVRDMCVSPDGKTVYGIAGDAEGYCSIFTYDDRNGLRIHGHAYANDAVYGICSSPQLAEVALTQDGKTLVVCSGEQEHSESRKKLSRTAIETVYLYTIS